MPDYRFFFMTIKGRIDAPATILNYETDDQAIRAAKAVNAERAIEIWKGAELIALIKGNPKRRLE